MIRQYLSNRNENVTVPILKKEKIKLNNSWNDQFSGCYGLDDPLASIYMCADPNTFLLLHIMNTINTSRKYEIQD